MTEEEYFRKNYPDACYGDKPLSPYWDYFQDGVEFGERQSEEKVVDLEETINKLREQLALRYDLEDKIAELKEQLERAERARDYWKDSSFDWRHKCTSRRPFRVAVKAQKQLTKAKEIISELLNSCFGYNSKTVNYEVKAKAEQFLKEE